MCHLQVCLDCHGGKCSGSGQKFSDELCPTQESKYHVSKIPQIPSKIEKKVETLYFRK